MNEETPMFTDAQLEETRVRPPPREDLYVVVAWDARDQQWRYKGCTHTCANAEMLMGDLGRRWHHPRIFRLPGDEDD